MSRAISAAAARAAFLLLVACTRSAASAQDAAAPADPAVAGTAAPAGEAPRAEPAPLPIGLSLSLRTGWGIPLGDAFATSGVTRPLDREFSGRLNVVQGDFGIRLARRLVLGGYLALDQPFLVPHGRGVVALECHQPGARRCGGVTGVRVGVQALLKPWVDRALEPWLGVGTGYERAEYAVDGPGDETSLVAYQGWEIVNLQAGLDLRLSRLWRIGPYASVAFGRYNAIEVYPKTVAVAVPIDARKVHEWIELGIRATVEGDLRGSLLSGAPGPAAGTGAGATAGATAAGVEGPPPAALAAPAARPSAPGAPPDGTRRGAPDAAAPAPAPPRYPLAPAGLTLSFGLGAAGSTGRVGGHAGATSDWWDPGPMLDVYLDAGFRVTRHVALVLYLDVAVGDASRSLTRWCEARNLECGAVAGRFGLLARYAFTPEARATAWVAAGTGFESADVLVEQPENRYAVGAPGDQTISFTGWEILKLGGGWDLRRWRWLGFGVFAYASVGTFSKVSTDGPAIVTPGDLGARGVHLWALAGARVVVGP